MELDVFVPSLRVAFEYQGSQHYDYHYSYGSAKRQEQRDLEKRLACRKDGIRLIEIPYWSDTTPDGIRTMLAQNGINAVAPHSL